MAERIRLLLEDPALQDALGLEARRRTVGEFDYDRMVADLMELYEGVLPSNSIRRLAV
jgi:glycosyltransferase involved in cell wall biosynthesis